MLKSSTPLFGRSLPPATLALRGTYRFPGRAGSQPARGQQAGQALIIAVLVLFAVATLAALFTAIISSHLVQVTRHSDVVRLRNIAEAGLRLANEQLTYSREGADWRPPKTTYRCGGAELRVEVAYEPAHGDLQSRFVAILASAAFPNNPFLRHTILGLKPVLLADYALFVTDRFETNRPARLGVTGAELGGQPRTDYLYYVEGPIRSNTDLVWSGRSELHLYTSFDATWRDLGVLRDDRIEVAGNLLPDPNRSAEDTLRLLIDGVTRATDLFSPQTDEEQADYEAGFADWEEIVGGPNPRVLAELEGSNTVAVPRVRPPEIDAVHPDMLTNRYLLLTRDAGHWAARGDGTWYNTGELGWGWADFGGIYIDNLSDIQYQHDLEKLRLNWMASVGAHQTAGDRRDAGTPGPLSGPADWWDKTGRYYAPPGVEIVLHGEAPCPYIEIIRHDPRGPEGGAYYWQQPDTRPVPPDPNPQLEGDISYVYSPGAGMCALSGGFQAAIYDGNRARFPFPPNGVIYAEGNVRLRGIMPPVRDNQGRTGAAIPAEAVPLGYFGDWNASNGRSRRYDLQVVSGGTIYIEGDLLTPAAAALIPGDYAADKLYGSRLALLARDYVCVNTTALNPRPQDLFRAVGADLYNDAQPLYPPTGYPQYWKFQGVPATDYTNTPWATDPPSIGLVYENVRLQGANLRAGVPDLRLLVGHSGWYTVGGTGQDPQAPPSDLADVRVELAIGPANQPATATPFQWAGGNNRYTFINGGVPANDQSAHWYTEADQLEFLPSASQPMQVLGLLSGDDLISFTSRVTPVPNSDGDAWIVDPIELAYVLGPIAVAPPRYLNGDPNQPADPLRVEIDALIYAQNGSWFIIPGSWFNEDPHELGLDPTQQEYPGYHEPLNIRISVRGAITENMPADLGSVADWTSKWGGPLGRGAEGFLSYAYDPLLRWPRRETQEQVGYLRFPNFPITSELVIWGERVSGAAS